MPYLFFVSPVDIFHCLFLLLVGCLYDEYMVCITSLGTKKNVIHNTCPVTEAIVVVVVLGNKTKQRQQQKFHK
ncbi:hypothetical protein BLA29_007258 [Euroglyphus maynei]|uniref:Uncharacterized protein n=1 Tax=Euroglyphus maynei TaxID=6958 RepID=A0A1Y3AUZ4_EURMA|nr:hypothetical protein BLA29_007258 [Euroglyphus maynei]